MSETTPAWVFVRNFDFDWTEIIVIHLISLIAPTYNSVEIISPNSCLFIIFDGGISCQRFLGLLFGLVIVANEVIYNQIIPWLCSDMCEQNWR